MKNPSFIGENGGRNLFLVSQQENAPECAALPAVPGAGSGAEMLLDGGTDHCAFFTGMMWVVGLEGAAALSIYGLWHLLCLVR